MFDLCFRESPGAWTKSDNFSCNSKAKHCERLILKYVIRDKRLQMNKATMPKKSPTTVTGGKKKRSPGENKDSKHKAREQADLETPGKEASSGERNTFNTLTIYSRTSTQPWLQASTSHQFSEEGKFNKPLQKGFFRVTFVQLCTFKVNKDCNAFRCTCCSHTNHNCLSNNVISPLIININNYNQLYKSYVSLTHF